MIRARMRSPVCILSRSLAVCCGDSRSGVFLPAAPDFRAFLPDRDGLVFLVSSRISSRWWCVIGPPCPAAVSLSGSCRSPRIELGRQRLPLRYSVCASRTTKRTSHRGPHWCGSPQAPSSSVSPSPLPPGLGGITDRLPAVAHDFIVFSDQSASWENRALSLERDFIDVVGRAVP